MIRWRALFEHQRRPKLATIERTTGALRVVPVSATLLLLGFLAVTGSPPFGPFISEFTILGAAVAQERYGVVALFLCLLVVIFIGMGSTVLTVVQGSPPAGQRLPIHRETFGTVAPPALLLLLVLLLGLYVPPPVHTLLHDAAAFLGGGS